jgi:hypothetical protein
MGLVKHTEAGKAYIYIYQAAGSNEQTQDQLIRDLSDRLFAGSAGHLATA